MRSMRLEIQVIAGIKPRLCPLFYQEYVWNKTYQCLWNGFVQHHSLNLNQKRIVNEEGAMSPYAVRTLFLAEWSLWLWLSCDGWKSDSAKYTDFHLIILPCLGYHHIIITSQPLTNERKPNPIQHLCSPTTSKFIDTLWNKWRSDQ